MEENARWKVTKPDNYESLKNLTGALNDIADIHIRSEQSKFRENMLRIRNAISTTIINMMTNAEKNNGRRD